MLDQLKKMDRLTYRAADLKSNLAKVEAELEELAPQNQKMIEQIADVFLVDATGQPVDGLIYWYNNIGVLRHGFIVTTVPVQTMNEKEIAARLNKTEQAELQEVA